jgi:signal transduction histidine kinase
MEMSEHRRPALLWPWIVAVWFGFGLVDAVQTVFVMRAEGMHHVWLKLFVVTIFFWAPWALATQPVMRLGLRFPPVQRRSPGTWIVHLSAFSAIGLLFTAWTTWLERFFDLYGESTASGPFSRLLLERFLSGFLSSLVLYAGILTISYLVQSRARLADQQTQTARLNEQLSKAQFEALRKQIEPHFLFNALNSITGMVRAGKNEAAVTMIVGLSDFMRRTLEEPTRQQVPLEEELEFTEKYLSIQQVRFAGRLKLEMDVPFELYQAQVPSLILQPIVENAVKHGIAMRAHGGAIRIAGSRTDGMLTLVVFNDGPDLMPGAGTGIGNMNVRARLQSLYGDAFSFEMHTVDSGGVEVTVSLPYEVRPSATETR